MIGATAALSATPGMLGYGLSKVGAHHFIQTLGETTGKALTTKLKRKQARRLRRDSEYLDTLSVVGILPTTIDTPSNRDAMPNANFDKWTKPLDIAKELKFDDICDLLLSKTNVESDPTLPRQNYVFFHKFGGAVLGHF